MQKEYQDLNKIWTNKKKKKKKKKKRGYLEWEKDEIGLYFKSKQRLRAVVLV